MNTIKLDVLKKITNVTEVNNIEDDILFDYFRIVAIDKIKHEKKSKNPLYFITYARNDEANNGWYIKKVDIRPHINNIFKDNPNATFVIEKNMLDKIEDKSRKYIIVDDINDTIDDLFRYFKNKSKSKTIAITGSVGKTTCVGLIEKVLKEKYNVLRIYSKRITPLILKANIINNLTSDIEYIVLENSIYYHNHVEILTDILKPEITCILDIDSSHLGIEKLQTIDDICKYKAMIMKYAKVCYLNSEDKYLNKITQSKNKIYYDNIELLTNNSLELTRTNEDLIKVCEEKFIIDNNIIIKPFILSNLSKVQYLITYELGKSLGLSNKQIEKGMNKYKPVENRLQTLKAFNKKIIFDGDITTYERIKQLSNNMYHKKYLVLRKVGSAENTLRIEDIKEYFCKYKKVFIFNDMDYYEKFMSHPNVKVVKNHNFMSKLNGTIIYHYSGYYRSFENFDEHNLEVYDREKYRVIK